VCGARARPGRGKGPPQHSALHEHVTFRRDPTVVWPPIAPRHTRTYTHTHTHVHMHKHIYIHIVQSNVTFLTCLTFLTFVDSALIGFRTPGFTTPRSPRLTPAGHKATVRLSATMLPEKVVLTCVRRISAMSNGAKRSKQPQSCRSFHR
jgi:hypothetical protein